MAVRKLEELMSKAKELFGDDSRDEVLEFYEDISDTYVEREGDGEDWKSRYEENDKMWRDKYRERFFKKVDEETEYTDVDGDGDVDEVKKYEYEDLFEEKEDK